MTTDVLSEDGGFDYSGLRALFINCTLKPSPALSHTQVLADRAIKNHAPAPGRG